MLRPRRAYVNPLARPPAGGDDIDELVLTRFSFHCYDLAGEAAALRAEVSRLRGERLDGAN